MIKATVFGAHPMTRRLGKTETALAAFLNANSAVYVCIKGAVPMLLGAFAQPPRASMLFRHSMNLAEVARCLRSSIDKALSLHL